MYLNIKVLDQSCGHVHGFIVIRDFTEIYS